MKNLSFLCLITISGWQTMAIAANTVGNGGDIIVCTPSEGVRSAELLDLYEARVMRSLTIDLGDPSLSIPDKVNLAIERIRVFNPAIADLYQSYADSFEQEQKFVTNIDLPEVEDSGEIFRENFCAIKQIAIQRQPQHFLDKRYWIDTRLWDILNDNDSKAGLILHEIIYRDALARGHENSIHVRYLTGLIASTEMSNPTMNAEAFNQILQHEMFMGYSFYGPYGHQTFTFFDRIGPLNFLQADQFCRSLPGNSYLFSYFAIDDTDRGDFYSSESSIYRFITGPDGTASLKIWAPMSRTGIHQTFYFNDGWQPADVLDPNERNYFICVSEE